MPSECRWSRRLEVVVRTSVRRASCPMFRNSNTRRVRWGTTCVGNTQHQDLCGQRCLTQQSRHGPADAPHHAIIDITGHFVTCSPRVYHPAEAGGRP